MKSGLIALIGRPNTGKSTLLNALIGQKVAITSSKPQTTRHSIRGIVTTPNAQIVFVDTPGMHRPRTLLGERLNEIVRSTYADVDVIAMCFPADEPCGAGDTFIVQEIADAPIKRIALVTKIDNVAKADLPMKLMEVDQLAKKANFEWNEIVPVSAKTTLQLDVVLNVLAESLSDGPQMYPEDQKTDETEFKMIAELIREAALEGVRDEIPHSIAVVVEEVLPRRTGKQLIDVRAFLYVERPSQKAIIIGKNGTRLKEVGSAARLAIENYLGGPIYLDLHVKVAKEWQSDPKALNRMGW